MGTSDPGRWCPQVASYFVTRGAVLCLTEQVGGLVQLIGLTKGSVYFCFGPITALGVAMGTLGVLLPAFVDREEGGLTRCALLPMSYGCPSAESTEVLVWPYTAGGGGSPPPRPPAPPSRPK